MNPCLSCGACCACYRVDFSALELDSQGGCVPAGLAVELNASLCRLIGTDHTPPRCAALVGRVGEDVSCGIYPFRPGPCYALEAGSDACQRARRRYALPALD